jgi:hypothetical protein
MLHSNLLFAGSGFVDVPWKLKIFSKQKIVTLKHYIQLQLVAQNTCFKDDKYLPFEKTHNILIKISL